MLNFHTNLLDPQLIWTADCERVKIKNVIQRKQLFNI